MSSGRLMCLRTGLAISWRCRMVLISASIDVCQIVQRHISYSKYASRSKSRRRGVYFSTITLASMIQERQMNICHVGIWLFFCPRYIVKTRDQLHKERGVLFAEAEASDSHQVQLITHVDLACLRRSQGWPHGIRPKLEVNNGRHLAAGGCKWRYKLPFPGLMVHPVKRWFLLGGTKLVATKCFWTKEPSGL